MPSFPRPHKAGAGFGAGPADSRARAPSEPHGPRAPHAPDSVKQDVNEEGVALGRDVAFGQEHLVIAALHQVLRGGGGEEKRMRKRQHGGLPAEALPRPRCLHHPLC